MQRQIGGRVRIAAIAASLAGCSPAVPSPGVQVTAQPPFAASRESNSASPSRWVLLPDRAAADAEYFDQMRPRAVIVDGLRLVENPASAPIQSSNVLPGSSHNAVVMPESVGGGFLFFAEVESETAFWRAADWTAPLVPLARLPERVEQVEVGFGRVYARLADSGETLAFDPDSGKSTDLGPLPPSPSYFDLQFWDDWFALVHTDARGVLATFDAGATWHPTGVTDESAALVRVPEGILVSGSARRDLLGPDGVWAGDYEGEPSELDLPPPSYASELGRNPLELAVRHGYPLANQRALVANLGHVGVVSLETGVVEQVSLAQYSGSVPCQGLALGKGVGFVCLLTNGHVALYAVQSDLTLVPRVTWPSPTRLWTSGRSDVISSGSCPEASTPFKPNRGEYCIVSGEQASRTLRIPQSNPSNGQERVVVLEDGRVVVVNPPQPNAEGTLRLTGSNDLALGPKRPLTFAKETPDRVRAMVLSGLWLYDGGQLTDEHVGFWVATTNRLVGVKLSLDGTLTVSQRTEADLRRTHSSGPRAVELMSGETAWQSVDYGQTWREFAVPRGLTAASTRDTRDLVGCSTLGCSFGNWLRIGYELEGATVPEEAALPKLVEHRPSAYSQWSLTCYPTGNSESAQKGSSLTALEQGQGRPRHGSSSGFIGSGLTVTTGADVVNSANRPFLGVPKPGVPHGSFAFDMGADGVHQFRSYAWGFDGQQWLSSGAWLTRSADRFSVSGLWSTAPTRAPWPNLLTAAQLFGSDRANRHSSTWQLNLDPKERGGVLRITTTGTTELHFIEEGQATLSVGNTAFGSISGVVKLQKAWYFGTQDGNRFRIYRVRNGEIDEFADLPVGDSVAPMLTRNTGETALGVVLRAPAGTWHIYPISEDGKAEEPVVFDRGRLNEEWERCTDDELGFYVIAALPLSRFTPNDGADVVTFEGVPPEWKAEAVTARTVVSASNQCVEALAARLASNQDRLVSLARRLPPTPGGIPLTLTDRLHDVRHGFQCLP